VHQLFVDFKKAYDSVRREALYNTLTEFGIFLKLVWLIKKMSIKHWWNESDRKTEILGEILVPVPISPPQISYGLPRNRTC
jgi:hypothetical protein